MTIKITVYAHCEGESEILGYVSRDGCENEECIAAVSEGFPWHCTVLGGVKLNSYHFRTSDAAIQQLENIFL